MCANENVWNFNIKPTKKSLIDREAMLEIVFSLMDIAGYKYRNCIWSVVHG